jgi:serine/threonine protein kinase
VLSKGQIIPEIAIHSLILKAGLKGKIRVANFHSIVISKDATMMMGLLFDFIPSIGESLYSNQRKIASEHHAKWKQQVTAIIKELHSHDIVWGDVHPGNIVIDKNFDAWVVNFGVGCTEEFVERKKVGTKEGDWEGVRRTFEEWITR